MPGYKNIIPIKEQEKPPKKKGGKIALIVLLIVLLSATTFVMGMLFGNSNKTPVATEAPDTTVAPNTTEAPLDIIAPGLYDANDNLLASWDELVNTYGMSVDTDYTFGTYKTKTSSPYYVFTNTKAPQNGTRLVLGSTDKIGNYAFYSCSTLFMLHP